MNFLYTILYILLFIFCLSILVLVHELGHFATAKFFKVYVKEFSIGFGPSLLHKKRKNGETYFSLRAIPFGGYVSMYGEGMEEDPEFADVDPSRKFTALKKWKRIIILFAGVFNNAILALILFMISESCFEQKMLYLSYVNVEAGSIAETAGLVDSNSISLRSYTNTDDKKTYYIVDKENAYVTNQSDVETPVYAMIDITNITFTSRDFETYLKFYLKDAEGNVVTGHEYKATDVKSVRYTVTKSQGKYVQYVSNAWVEIPEAIVLDPQVGQAYINKDEKAIYKWDGANWKKTTYDLYGYIEPETKTDYMIWYNTEYTLTPHQIALNSVTKDDKKVFEASGLSVYLDHYWNNAGQVAKNTFIDFGNSATAIGRGLASLFTSTDNWKDVGGVIAIGQQTTNILQNFGLAKFIYIWGLISVNLAIINLLPFPGLDGWQIVVLIVESVAHREIPDKVKNIVSFIGLAILFSFMILILIKDFIGLFQYD